MGLERAAIECCCEYEDEVELRPLWCPPPERGPYSPPTLLVVLVWLTFRESSERDNKDRQVCSYFIITSFVLTLLHA